MDPYIENIILGVVANGVTSILAYIGGRAGKLFVGEELLQETEKQKTDLDPILRQAIETVSEELDWENPEIHLFLASPEAEAIVRQIFAAKAVGIQESQHFLHIRQEFQASLALYLGWPENRLANSAKVLFDALLDGCDRALIVAIDQGILAAHEAKSTTRHHILLNEVATVQRNLDLLTASQNLDLRAILEFEEKYRKQVGNRHRFIIPPDFDRARKVPIDELYVSPDFASMPKQQEEMSRTVSLAEFQAVIYRTVLLGDPGSGKSTFAAKLCHSLAERYTERLLAGRHLTPIHVTLREYGTARKETACSIAQFITQTAESIYQLPAPPPNTFEYLLLNGRAIVVFDGLDELLDTSYRRAISTDIESFCALYPSVPVMVTSRKVGYEQAPLDPREFDVFHIAPFDEEKSETYVRKWFRVEGSLTRQQQKEKATSFVAESRSVPDLRANPLLLALMCNIYRGEGYIPKNRPDVYEKCATMLFERWDKGRGIHYVLPFEAHIRPTLMYLANWIYTEEKRQSGVTESELVIPATEYLYNRRFRDQDEAEHAARAFIEFCRGRAWVFTDVGTTAVGERLYQFTHRTFLEYFTSAYLVRIHRTPEALIAFLLPRILEKEWDVVAQLAFQLQNKRLEGAGDELLTSLVEYDTADARSRNALSFAARCLEFLVPSPDVSEAIVRACIDRAILWAVTSLEEAPDRSPETSREEVLPEKLLRDLSIVAVENRDAIVETLKETLQRYIHSHSELKAYLALEIGTDLHLMMGFTEDCWRDAASQICQDNLERLQSLQPKFYLLCLRGLECGSTSIRDLVRWHGLARVFVDTHRTTSGWFHKPVSEWLVSAACFVHRDEHAFYKNRKHHLAEIGQVLLSSSPPWMGMDDIKGRLAFDLYGQFGVRKDVEYSSAEALLALESEALFGLLALLAVHMEIAEKMEQIDEVLALIHSREIPILDLLRTTLSSRYRQVDADEVNAKLAYCHLTDPQKEFLWQWMRREIDLVR